MTDVPTMDEVLRDAPKNWGKWGEGDEVGALNYLKFHRGSLPWGAPHQVQYTFLYTAAPLKVNAASGSPGNPLVIK